MFQTTITKAFLREKINFKCVQLNEKRLMLAAKFIHFASSIGVLVF